MNAERIMLIRHAEKPSLDGVVLGVDINGQQSTDELSVRGWQRAGALVRFFFPLDAASARKGIGVPQHLFAPMPTAHVRSVRALHTLTPLGEGLGIEVSTSFRKGDESGLAASIVERSGVVLVAWEHHAIIAIADALMGGRVATPQEWPDDRFDLVWVFDRSVDGWSFSRVPQLLLPGDSQVIVA